MNWNKMPRSHKIATVIAGLAVLVWLVYEVRPGLFPFDVTCPAVAVFTVCEAVTYWKEKRIWAWLFLAAAAVSMVFFLL